MTGKPLLIILFVFVSCKVFSQCTICAVCSTSSFIGCTYSVSTDDSIGYTITAGQKLCVTGGTYKGNIILSGGTIVVSDGAVFEPTTFYLGVNMGGTLEIQSGSSAIMNGLTYQFTAAFTFNNCGNVHLINRLLIQNNGLTKINNGGVFTCDSAVEIQGSNTTICNSGTMAMASYLCQGTSTFDNNGTITVNGTVDQQYGTINVCGGSHMYVYGNWYAFPSAFLSGSGSCGYFYVRDTSECLSCTVSGTLNFCDSSSYLKNSGVDINSYGVWSNSITYCSCSSLAPPVADFQTLDTMICANACISFTDLSSRADAWLWTFTGGTPSSSTLQNPQNICYLTGGVYDVNLIAYNSAGSNNITFSNYINVLPAPPTPVITQSGDTLKSSADPNYTSYQWYDNTTLIPNATDTFLVISTGGNYNMQVINESGCSTATGINVILGLDKFTSSGFQFTVNPNPVGKELKIIPIKTEVELNMAKVTVYIMNTLGQTVSQSQTLNRQFQIDVSYLPSGIYFITVADEKELWIGRFVKE